MSDFDDLVLDSMVTARGLRSRCAGHLIAAIRHAEGWGLRGHPGLTPEELGILRCLRLRVEGRTDQPERDDLDYAGTTGLLGWVLRITAGDPRIAERQPEYHALITEFSHALDRCCQANRPETGGGAR